MKLISEACEYALRTVVWLARQPEGSYKTREMAKATHAAPGYLVKVLQSLSRAKILSGQRGSQGGFKLLSDPAELTVLDVINAVDPFDRINICPLGFKAHGGCLCPLHRRVDDAMASIEASFQSTTIKDLISTNEPSQPLCNVLSLPVQTAKSKPDGTSPRDLS